MEIKNEGRFRITIEEDYTCLEISDLVRSDDGNYKVDLENPAGSYWASAGLVVTGELHVEVISHTCWCRVALS